MMPANFVREPLISFAVGTPGPHRDCQCGESVLLSVKISVGTRIGGVRGSPGPTRHVKHWAHMHSFVMIQVITDNKRLQALRPLPGGGLRAFRRRFFPGPMGNGLIIMMTDSEATK